MCHTLCWVHVRSREVDDKVAQFSEEKSGLGGHIGEGKKCMN